MATTKMIMAYHGIIRASGFGFKEKIGEPNLRRRPWTTHMKLKESDMIVVVAIVVANHVYPDFDVSCLGLELNWHVALWRHIMHVNWGSIL